MTFREAIWIARPPRLVTWRGIIALGLSFSLLLFLARSFEPDLTAAAALLGNADPRLLCLALAAHYSGLFVRGLRWRRMLLAASPAPAAVPSALACSVYLLLCWFVNAITWLRLGNVYRAHLASRDMGGGFVPVLGTVLAERFLDLGAVLLMLILAALLLLGLGTGESVAPFLFTSLVAASGLGLIVLLLGRPHASLPWLPDGFSTQYERFRLSVRANLQGSELPVSEGLTLAGWGFEAARLWLVVRALGLDMPLEMLLFVAFAQALLLSLPLTPGGLGVVEPGLTGLLLLSFDRPEAVSVTLLDRSISYLSVVVIGAAVFGVREMAALVNRRGEHLRPVDSPQSRSSDRLTAKATASATAGTGCPVSMSPRQPAPNTMSSTSSLGRPES